MSTPTTKSSLPESIISQIPKSDICQSTLNLTSSSISAPIFNHSLRVYLLAKWLADKESNQHTSNLADDQTVLFIACLCHDLGTSDLNNGTQRFEVEGADAACKHMRAHGISDESSLHKVWTAIALHTSPGIAERIDPLTRLVRLGVKMDFSRAVRDEYGATEYAEEIERLLPRMEVEKVLGDAVVKQAGRIPEDMIAGKMTWLDSEKHPKASWPGILLRAHLENPEWKGINPAF
ncbi:metal dependent phosphohydrolase [Moniliophthora roreri MCA 2997]|uniref:Metal dependent phosphohydrolase n=2 Tax=Moniliophthora roreri TaxID=221103 RepID=V2WN67_MONRO|nr:metal dependent phosphohydrolase [Moniliophthora roreri MCA 2997]